MSEITPDIGLAQRYDKAARNWGRKMDRFGFGPAYGDMLATRLPRKRFETVLDAGAGSGAFARAAQDIGLNISALHLLDPSAEMLACAQSRLTGPLRCFKGDIAGHIAPARYDLVLCAHVIEHCEDPVETLHQLRAMLRPGGYLALVVSKPHWCSTLVYLRWRHKTFRPATVVEMLQEAGFGTVHEHAFLTGVPGRVSHGYIATSEPPERT